MDTVQKIANETVELATKYEIERQSGNLGRSGARDRLKAFLSKQPDRVLIMLMTLMYAGHPDANAKESISRRYEDEVRRLRSGDARIGILLTKQDLANRMTKGLEIAAEQSFDLEQALDSLTGPVEPGD